MISLRIVTPEGIVFDKQSVEAITLPTQSGVITVLEDHRPLVTLLKAGEIEIKLGEYIEELAVSTGMVEVRRDSIVNILADTADRASEIDIAKAKEARKRAEEYLEQNADEIADVDYARLQAIIERETARIRLGNRYRKLNNVPSSGN